MYDRKPGYFAQIEGSVPFFGRITDDEGKVVGDDVVGNIEMRANEHDILGGLDNEKDLVNADGYIPTNRIGKVELDGTFIDLGPKHSIEQGRSR